MVMLPLCASYKAIHEYKPLLYMNDEELAEWGCFAFWEQTKENYNSEHTRPKKRELKNKKKETPDTTKSAYNIFKGDMIYLEHALSFAHMFYGGGQKKYLWRCPECHTDPLDLSQHCTSFGEFENHYYVKHNNIPEKDRFRDWTCRACGIKGENCRSTGIPGSNRFERIINHINHVGERLIQKCSFPEDFKRIFKTVVLAREQACALDKSQDFSAIVEEYYREVLTVRKHKTGPKSASPSKKRKLTKKLSYASKEEIDSCESEFDNEDLLKVVDAETVDYNSDSASTEKEESSAEEFEKTETSPCFSKKEVEVEKDPRFYCYSDKLKLLYEVALELH